MHDRFTEFNITDFCFSVTLALALQPGDALVYKRRADVRSKLSWKEKALDDYKQAILIQTQRRKVLV